MTEAKQFVDAICRVLACADLPHKREAGIFAELMNAVTTNPAASPPRTLPALRFLQSSLAGLKAPGDNARRLTAAIDALQGKLCWRNVYADTPANAALHDRFAFCDAVSPRDLLKGDGVTAGLVLLGPDLLYPLHMHPAIELYVVLSGTAEWQMGDKPFEPLAPGCFRLHETNVPHAMRTQSEPLLALSLWRGDISSPSRLA